jgi:gluconate kinase
MALIKMSAGKICLEEGNRWSWLRNVSIEGKSEFSDFNFSVGMAMLKGCKRRDYQN